MMDGIKDLKTFCVCVFLFLSRKPLISLYWYKSIVNVAQICGTWQRARRKHNVKLV